MTRGRAEGVRKGRFNQILHLSRYCASTEWICRKGAPGRVPEKLLPGASARCAGGGACIGCGNLNGNVRLKRSVCGSGPEVETTKEIAAQAWSVCWPARNRSPTGRRGRVRWPASIPQATRPGLFRSHACYLSTPARQRCSSREPVRKPLAGRKSAVMH